jgi:RNA polymerase sigma factor (sigma-70 family)
MAQDVWLKVHANLDRLRDPDRFVPWLYRTARNCHLDVARSRQRRPQSPVGDGEGEVELTAADGDAPEQQVLALDDRRKVWETLGSLNERHRTALFLREFQGLSYAEIALALGISRGAAEVLLFRAREAFRRHFVQIETSKHRCSIDPLRLSGLLDGELSNAGRDGLEEHVKRCSACSDRLQTMQTGRKLYRGFGLLAVPEAAHAALAGKIGALLAGSSAAGTAATAAVVGGGGGAAGAGFLGGLIPSAVAKMVAVTLSVGAIATVAIEPAALPYGDEGSQHSAIAAQQPGPDAAAIVSGGLPVGSQSQPAMAAVDWNEAAFTAVEQLRAVDSARSAGGNAFGHDKEKNNENRDNDPGERGRSDGGNSGANGNGRDNAAVHARAAAAGSSGERQGNGGGQRLRGAPEAAGAGAGKSEGSNSARGNSDRRDRD